MHARIVATIGAVAQMARADTIVPPQSFVQITANTKHRLSFDPRRGMTVEDKDAKGRWRLSWRPKLNGPAWLAGDGRHLVACYEGLNHLPSNAGDQVLIRFFDKEKLVRAWTLEELMDPANLRRTVSNYAWGYCWNLDPLGRLEVLVEECRHVYFDLTTGDAVDEQLRDQAFTNAAGEITLTIPCTAKARFSRSRP